ncbi:MAG: hypothetical protein IPO03_15935 [Bacteroidetes bacterium]|nr:hypothetical protein [Bacteroidota bacterium]
MAGSVLKNQELGWSVNWTPNGEIPDTAGNVPRNAIFVAWTLEYGFMLRLYTL